MDMVAQLERVRASGMSPAERAQCLDTITAEASRVRSGRDADAAAAVLGKVPPVPSSSCWQLTFPVCVVRAASVWVTDTAMPLFKAKATCWQPV